MGESGVGAVSKLSLGWMKIGIVDQRIQTGRPQQNGRHERMRRTLKEDTTNPAALTLRFQQREFDRFRGETRKLPAPGQCSSLDYRSTRETELSDIRRSVDRDDTDSRAPGAEIRVYLLVIHPVDH
jgi:hypothetical protein